LVNRDIVCSVSVFHIHYDIDYHRKFFKKKISDQQTGGYPKFNLTLDISDATAELPEINKTKFHENLFAPENKQYPLIDYFDENMNNYFKSTYLIKLILRWKWHLLIITLLAIVLSSVFSAPAFIKPKYKSYAVIYPANISPYSSETNTEQLLQLLKSEDLLFDIVKKFELNKEYKVDTTDKYYRSKVIAELEDNVSIKRTEYESVLIEVYDREPGKACAIVNEFINLMNNKARNLQRSKTAEVVKLYRDQMDDKKKQIDSIEKRLQLLRSEYNILDYNIQVEEYSKGYVKNITSGRGNKTDDIAVTLNNLKLYGGEFRQLDANLWGLIDSYIALKKDFDQSVADMKKELTYANVVAQPVASDKKSYPIRWLIVCISTISAFLLSLLLFSIIEGTRKPETEKISQ